MINTRLISLIRKEFIQIFRNPRTLMLVLWIPIMQLLLMGYAATNDVRNVPLAVFDQDRGPATRRLLGAMKTGKNHQVHIAPAEPTLEDVFLALADSR